MKRQMLSVVLLFLPMFLAQFALSQQPMTPNYSGNSTISAISATSDCSSGGVNCWDTSALIAASSIIVSQSNVVALDSSGCAHLYSDPVRRGSNSWTMQTSWGCGLASVGYDGNGTLYALKSDSACTGETTASSTGPDLVGRRREAQSAANSCRLPMTALEKSTSSRRVTQEWARQITGLIGGIG